MAARRDALTRELVRDLASTPGGAWVTCAGRSMEPTLKLGDRLRIEACDRIRGGDVVLFEASRAYVLHRVVLCLPGTAWFVHIGDAGSGEGPGLAHGSRVVGRAFLPRRRPPLPVWWAGIKRLGRAARRRLGGARAAHIQTPRW
jgi:hypothetical protein